MAEHSSPFFRHDREHEDQRWIALFAALIGHRMPVTFNELAMDEHRRLIHS